MTQSRPDRSPAALGLVALVLGLLAGIAVAAWPALRPVVPLVEPVGALWINAIRMVLVPLVVSLLVTSVASVANIRALGRLGARTVTTFALLLAGTAVFAALVAPPLFARMPVDAASLAALRSHMVVEGSTADLPTVRGFIVGLVPVNPVKAAADGAMLPLIVFTLLVAVAATRLPEGQRAHLTGFFGALGEAMLVVVRWILALTPLGVFALALPLAADLGLAAAGVVGYYILVLSGMLLAVTLLLYPVAALVGRTPLRTFARACLPAQALAAGSRSSLASLPALIEGSRRAFGERPSLTGFVLPLAVSTFKINVPVSDLVGPLFLAQLYGVELSAAQVLTMTALSLAMSFSVPGIPSGGLFVITAPVMLSVGLPLEGIGLLIAADAIPDVFATVANVTGDMAVATMVAPVAPDTPTPGEAAEVSTLTLAAAGRS